MYFPKFWAQASVGETRCWHWSDVSVDDARALAREGAKKLSELFSNAKELPVHKKGEYWYSDRPLREEVLEEIKDSTGVLTAAVTRNAYGAKVLNTSSLLTVDVDLPEVRPEGLLQKLVRKLTGRASTNGSEATQEQVLAKVKSWCKLSPQWGWRVYKTKGGLRLIATQGAYSVESAETQRAFDVFGADLLYRKLCKAQRSFRARLSPKPWRIEFAAPPYRWPFEDGEKEKVYKEWLSRYDREAASYATCTLLEHVGNQSISSEIRALVELHDRETKATASDPSILA